MTYLLPKHLFDEEKVRSQIALYDDKHLAGLTRTKDEWKPWDITVYKTQLCEIANACRSWISEIVWFDGRLIIKSFAGDSKISDEIFIPSDFIMACSSIVRPLVEELCTTDVWGFKVREDELMKIWRQMCNSSDRETLQCVIKKLECIWIDGYNFILERKSK